MVSSFLCNFFTWSKFSCVNPVLNLKSLIHKSISLWISLINLLLKLSIASLVSPVNIGMKKILKTIYDWKINIIRKYPVSCAIVAWLEGIIIGILIYHYFMMDVLSCCNG